MRVKHISPDNSWKFSVSRLVWQSLKSNWVESGFFSSTLTSTGDPAVGKTALAQIFRSDGAQFQKNYTLVSGGGV